MKIRKMNIGRLASTILREFESEMKKFQKEYEAAVDGIYNANSYPGKFDVFPSPGGLRAEVSVLLLREDDDAALYQEYGTGIYMPDWWSPEKTESQRAIMGSEPRKYPRPGKLIGPRGAKWVDLGGREHKGAHAIWIDGKPLWGTFKGRGGTKGAPGKHLLERKSIEVFNIDKLRKITQNVIVNAFRKNEVTR